MDPLAGVRHLCQDSLGGPGRTFQSRERPPDCGVEKLINGRFTVFDRPGFTGYLLDNWRKPSPSLSTRGLSWSGVTIFFVNDGVSISKKMQVVFDHFKRKGFELIPLTRSSWPVKDDSSLARTAVARSFMPPRTAAPPSPSPAPRPRATPRPAPRTTRAASAARNVSPRHHLGPAAALF